MCSHLSQRGDHKHARSPKRKHRSIVTVQRTTAPHGTVLAATHSTPESEGKTGAPSNPLPAPPAPAPPTPAAPSAPPPATTDTSPTPLSSQSRGHLSQCDTRPNILPPLADPGVSVRSDFAVWAPCEYLCACSQPQLSQVHPDTANAMCTTKVNHSRHF